MTNTAGSSSRSIITVGMLISLLPTKALLLGGNHPSGGAAATPTTRDGVCASLLGTAPRTCSTTSLCMSSYDGGWDNDNFLDSLGGGGNNAGEPSEAIEQANDEYFRQSRYGRPAVNDGNAQQGWVPQRQQQQQQQQSWATSSSSNLSAMTEAAAEIYEYSYNKDAPTSDAIGGPSPPAPATPAGETEGSIQLAPGLVDKVKAFHLDEKEEASQGGSRFRTLMERAEEQQRTAPRATHNPLLSAYDPNAYAQQQQQQQQGGGATPPSSIMTPEEIASLSIDEQARLYREFFYVQQQKQAATKGRGKSIGSTANNYLEPGIGFDGRKIGRNKDAEAVSNAGDVYLARLKRDSTTRNLARYRGDEATANEVFHDPSIAEIEAPVNPYLEDQRKRMMDVVETVPEEMLLFREFESEEERAAAEAAASAGRDRSYSGISYKERMARVREERRKNNSNNKADQPPPEGNNPGNPYSY